jgi:hypothetical protein
MTVSDGAWSVRQKIISDFTVKVRNYIAHQTADRTTLVWPFFNNTAWGNGAGGAEAPFGSNVLANIILFSPSRGTESVDLATDPNGPTNGDLPAGSITATQVTNLITYWMGQYARSHRVTLNNTGSGNSGFSQVQLVVRLTQAQGGVAALVSSDVSNAITASGINSGTVATAEAVNDLIDQCQQIWKTRCRDVSRKTYNYNYCHANHLSHSNHGSRGRR